MNGLGRTTARLAYDALAALDRRSGRHLADGLRLGVRLASRLGGGPRDRLRIFGLALLLASGAWRPRRPISLPLTLSGRRLAWRMADYESFAVLGEVFLDDVYGHRQIDDVGLILDLGSNIGASVLYLRDRYPEARIVAVEPSGTLTPVLRANVRQIGPVEVVEAAVDVHDGHVMFEATEASWSGRVVAAEQGSGAGQVRVAAKSLETLLDGRIPDVIKLDVEGGEWSVLPESDAWKQARCVLGEIHAPPNDARTARMTGLIAAAGFDVTTTNADTEPPDPHTNFIAYRTP